MKKTLRVLFPFLLAALLLYINALRDPGPGPVDPAQQTRAETQSEPGVAEATLQEQVQTPEVLQRVAVEIEPEAQAEQLISPLEALANYALDMRATDVEGRAKWFQAKGLVFSDAGFRKTFEARWAIPQSWKVTDFESAPFALYHLWLSRAAELKLDMLSAVLELYRSEADYDLWKHWLWFLPVHRAKGEVPVICDELRRYIELLDREQADRNARIRDTLQVLAILSGLDKSLRAEFLDIFANEAVAGALNEGAGMSVLMAVCAVLPYSEMAGKLQSLLEHPSANVQWGAVEMLRQYTSLGQINGERLVQMLPDRLLEKADGARSAASMELLATYGGQNGLERLLRLSREGDPVHRGAALEFLAATGRISTLNVLEYASDSLLTKSLVNSLATLAPQDSLAVRELERYLQHEDFEIQRLAAGYLAQLGRISLETAREYGVTIGMAGGD